MQDQNNTDLPQLQPTQFDQPAQQDPSAQIFAPFSDFPQQQVQPLGVAQTVVPLPAAAADDDLIEKEWVLKAKQIVSHTSDDPYTQQLELNKVKADYMKKRYNKDIRVEEA